MRAYFRVPESLDREMDYLCISYEKGVRPGYAWIFPGPDRIFNLGVGIFRDPRRGEGPVHLQRLWAAFTGGVVPALRILQEGECVSAVRGAPLRTALKGARLHRRGLLVIGEAAGLTYPFSGEGIGKAMESGILAAEIAGQHLARGMPSLDEAGPVYESTLRGRYGSRFLAYERAQDWLSRPAICSFIAWRANRSRRFRDQLEGMLTETTDPRNIFSATGLVRALFR
jgi:flavin-dependent dehydrogenase